MTMHGSRPSWPSRRSTRLCRPYSNLLSRDHQHPNQNRNWHTIWWLSTRRAMRLFLGLSGWRGSMVFFPLAIPSSLGFSCDWWLDSQLDSKSDFLCGWRLDSQLDSKSDFSYEIGLLVKRAHLRKSTRT